MTVVREAFRKVHEEVLDSDGSSLGASQISVKNDLDVYEESQGICLCLFQRQLQGAQAIHVGNIRLYIGTA